ncbi:hypothetical protein EJB05_27405, partial [Eragrostis curvula]
MVIRKREWFPQIGLRYAEWKRLLLEVFPPWAELLKSKTRIEGDQDNNLLPLDNKLSAQSQFKDKMKEFKQKTEEYLKIKWAMNNMEEILRDKRTLFILQDDQKYACRWGEIIDVLSLISFRATSTAVMVITTKSSQEAKEFCYPPHQEPIIYSLVPIYHDIVLDLIRHRQQQKATDQDNYFRPQILFDILDKCYPHEFCMKMFAHAVHANPNRRTKDMRKLHGVLVSQKHKSLNSKVERIFLFSYNDLPEEYKNCLLYLAIFPQGHNIRRSTLVVRWITEGLITKEDWPSAVRQAERCFDALVDRWFVCPVDMGAAGKVKSCMVLDRVHRLITKIAREEHIMETRLPTHLAMQFSIFCDLRLGVSDTMEDFLRQLSKSSRLLLFKMLDLEGCPSFKKNRRYLKDICSNILLLKYLSLMGTGISHLPKEINNLRDLEILDIRQAKFLDENATRDILLPKLKRLLAGHADASSSNSDTSTITWEEPLFYSVRIPCKVDKMPNMEVLSMVKLSQAAHQELENIRKLRHLRRLGVVIKYEDHFKYLLGAICSLEYLQSLSVTLDTDKGESIYPAKLCPKLESLTISGETRMQILPLLTKSSSELAKVSLSRTSLNQESFSVISEIPKLRCVRLRHNGYTEDVLMVKKDEFQNLNYFLVEGPNMDAIIFQNGAAPQLEKIVLSFTNISSISGVDHLPKLKEVELNGNKILLSLFYTANQITKVTLRGTMLKEVDLQVLARKPNMSYLVLLDRSFGEEKLAFNKDEFPKLRLLIVKCSTVTQVSFSDGSASWLQKIVWSFTKMESLSGISNLRKLKEVELNGDLVPNEVKEAIRNHTNILDFLHRKPQTQEQERGREAEEGDVARFPLLCWKSKVVVDD